MNSINVNRIICVLLWLICASYASGTEQTKSTPAERSNPAAVDKILEKLNKTVMGLTSYESQIEYKFIQPYMFDTQTLRQGSFYYIKKGNDSKLRLNFQTLQQDDEKQQKDIKQYVVVDGALLTDTDRKFSGYWFVNIDYEFKTVRYTQISEANDPNNPVDVFDLISRYLPIVGFTNVDDWKKQFDISIIEQNKSNNLIQINLKVKSDSVYNDNYVYIDCWIDKKLNLPVKITAVSTEPATEPDEQKERCEINFTAPKINQEIDNKIFDFEIPKGFGEPEMIPLNNNNNINNQ